MKLNLQYIDHPRSKERLVVLPESQFRLLERLAGPQRPATPEIGETSLPDAVLDRIARGENPIRAVRMWRGMTGQQLAALADITPSMLSQIERTGKTGSTRTFKALADALGVPLDLIFPASMPAEEP